MRKMFYLAENVKALGVFLGLLLGLNGIVSSQSPESIYKDIGASIHDGRWDKVFFHCTPEARCQFVFEMLSHYKHMNKHFAEIVEFKKTRGEIKTLVKEYGIEGFDVFVDTDSDPETREQFEEFVRQRNLKVRSLLAKMGMRKYEFLRKLSFSLSNTDYGRCSMSLGVAPLKQVVIDGKTASGTLDEWFTKVSKTTPSLYYPKRPVRFVKVDGDWKYHGVDEFAFFNPERTEVKK